MKVLIVGDSCGALASARELGAAGWTVGIGSGSRFGWAAASRWTSHWHYLPPLDDPEGFIRTVNRVTEKHGYEVVFGAGDAEVLLLSAYRERVAPLFPYAPHSCVIRGFDKLRLSELARSAGLSTPITREASQSALRSFDLPVVVKSRLHWNPTRPSKKGRANVVVAQSRDQAMRAAAILRSLGAEPLFQQYLPGTLLAFVALVDDKHRVVSRHVQLTTTERGSEPGQSARATSIPVDERWAAKVQALLSEILWFGLAQLQFQLRDDGEPVLTDFNGRMYGSMGLASACGMRAMDTWARLATGEKRDPVRSGGWSALPGPGR